MAFKKVGSLDPHGGSILRTVLLANSESFEISNAVEADQGSISLGVAGALLFGHIDGIITKEGVAPLTNGTTSGDDFTIWFSTSSTNTTVAKTAAICDVSKFSLYSADPDVALNTTDSSDELGGHTDIISGGRQTDESTIISTTAQYFVWGTDPDDTGNQLVNIYESDVFGV